jgi:ribonuclease D
MKWIDRQNSLQEALEEVGRQPSIAIDTEADSLHSYFDKVCLIQVTAAGDDLLIDPLAGLDLKPLAAILADRGVRKVLHGADYDLRILDRDFGINIANFVDTMVAAQLLGFPQVGLAALLKKYFDLDVDKSHQRANWAMRPLTPQMVHYATMDTHYLVELAAKLEEELRARGRWEWAEEEFARLEQIRFREPEIDPEAFRRVKGSSKLSRRGLGILSALFSWRDAQARSADRPPFKVLGNDAMLEISTRMPATLEDLAAIKGMPPSLLRRRGSDLVRIVRGVLEIPEEQLPEKTAAKPWIRDNELERRIERLKTVRDRVAAELGIDGAVLAPRHVLASIATLRPQKIEELSEVAALREWQKRLLAPGILEVTAS